MPNPKNDVFQKLYIPSYTPEQADLLRDTVVPKTLEEIQVELKEAMTPLQRALEDGEIGDIDFREPAPLTVSEAKVVVKEKQRLMKDILRIRKKLRAVNSLIDNTLTSKGKSFIYHFQDKPRLKKALAIVMGEDREYLTYGDYQKALAVKKTLEQEDSTAMFTEDDKERFEVV